MKKKFLLLIAVLFISFLFSEDLAPNEERFIELKTKVNYGFIFISWEVHGLERYDKLELKIKDRKEEVENIDITNRKYYVLDRDFPHDEDGKFSQISYWIIATVDISHTIGGKFYKTGTDYLASQIDILSPINFPKPFDAQYNKGIVYCRLWFKEPDLIERFYGFQIDGKDFKTRVDDYGNCVIKTGSYKKPDQISALFLSIDEPVIKQKSVSAKVVETKHNLAKGYSANSSDDIISYISADAIEDSLDPFDLKFEDIKNEESITISWNKIPEAEYYFVFRTPAVDSLYKSFYAKSNTGWKSSRMNRIKFKNDYHNVLPWSKEKLRSGFVYTYWVSARKPFEDLGISRKVSVYYFDGKKGMIKSELKEMEIVLRTEEYEKIESDHIGVTNSLADKGFQKHVHDFETTPDKIKFKVKYFELKPYRMLISGNDGYLRVGEVVRSFLPPKYGNNSDLLALMHVLNFDPLSEKPIIDESRIMVEDPIKIPVSVNMIEPDKE
ncbi:MAG: hypothetical protein K9N09_03230 [Candidatus Cloacimonetes bacterium]|nr:hypothetical protein [Candidatus Cloacimonadota bacterium]MCF7814519.1 hypothetical protein [Candidatus Cloacimonadota bacterium]MCF7867689.1 hypothetical protein [Candidatus Cloacimonadota bacterium]MCF7883513.1 hypothetical protein [Candidatus Cloacimonadota bacterium]